MKQDWYACQMMAPKDIHCPICLEHMNVSYLAKGTLQLAEVKDLQMGII